jgi:hypothetical protein
LKYLPTNVDLLIAPCFSLLFCDFLCQKIKLCDVRKQVVTTIKKINNFKQLHELQQQEEILQTIQNIEKKRRNSVLKTKILSNNSLHSNSINNNNVNNVVNNLNENNNFNSISNVHIINNSVSFNLKNEILPQIHATAIAIENSIVDFQKILNNEKFLYDYFHVNNNYENNNNNNNKNNNIQNNKHILFEKFFPLVGDTTPLLSNFQNSFLHREYSVSRVKTVLKKLISTLKLYYAQLRYCLKDLKTDETPNYSLFFIRQLIDADCLEINFFGVSYTSTSLTCAFQRWRCKRQSFMFMQV